MSAQKNMRPVFQSLELDPIDARLEAKAAEKGIPTLVTPKAESLIAEEATMPVEPTVSAARKLGRAAAQTQSTPRSRMKGLKIELPDYVWIALKKQAAEDMVSLRHLIMKALRAQGVAINDGDMVEDGRRFRD
jgi:hypothetical protein